MGIHDGHRKRLIQRFLEEGLDSFEPHNVLELLLFYSIPRRDTNELAHQLIDTFGSLNGVFNAPYEALMQIDGVGANTAALLKLVPQLTRTYYSGTKREIILSSYDEAGVYFLPYFIGRQEEVVFMVCLDAKSRVISHQLLHKGSVNSAETNIRKIMNVALQCNAVGVLLAHNHPGGMALPSPEDVATTRYIRDALRPMGVELLDHIIVADQDFTSLAYSGVL